MFQDTILFHLIILSIGIIALCYGGLGVINSSVAIADRFKIPSFIIGSTIVAYGTSLPEFLVSFLGLASPDQNIQTVAFGNLLGSNIINMFLILGLSITFMPIKVNRKAALKDCITLLVVSSAYFGFSFYKRNFTQTEGLVMVLMFVSFNAFTWYKTFQKKDKPEPADLPIDKVADGPNYSYHPYDFSNFKLTDIFTNTTIFDSIFEKIVRMRVLSHVLSLAIFFAVLFFGAKLVLHGGVDIATMLNVPPAIIAVTVVAIGTSLPELVTTVIAIVKKQADLGIGNIIGSNIFNLTASMLGVVVATGPISIDQMFFRLDLWYLLGSGIFITAAILLKNVLGRLTGITMLAIYISYVCLLLLKT